VDRCRSLPAPARRKRDNSRNEESAELKHASLATRSYTAPTFRPAHEGARARLAAIVHADRRAALGKLEGNYETDEPGTNHDDVAARSFIRSSGL